MAAVPVLIPDTSSDYFRNVIAGQGMRLYGATSGRVGLKPPATITNYDITLPSAAPTINGQALVCNTDGTSSFSSLGLTGQQQMALVW